MEVHRQTCQSCGNRTMNNLVVREPGSVQVILVRCQACGELVARYELSGYYHHHKGIESYLRTVAIATESAIDLQDTFAKLQEEAPKELEEATKILHDDGRNF